MKVYSCFMMDVCPLFTKCEAWAYESTPQVSKIKVYDWEGTGKRLKSKIIVNLLQILCVSIFENSENLVFYLGYKYLVLVHYCMIKLV